MWRPLTERLFVLPPQTAGEKRKAGPAATLGMTSRRAPMAVWRPNHSRRMRAGSVRVARQAGREQAASAATVLTTNAEPKASRARGVTSDKRVTRGAGN